MSNANVTYLSRNRDGTVPGGYRELMRVAWPLILSTASFTVMHFFDRVMLTRYSEVTAAAATCGGVLAFALLSFFLGIAGYANTFVAQYYGAGDRHMCMRCVWQGVYFAVAAGVFYPLVMGPLGVALLRWVAHPPAVLAAEEAYFTVLALGAAFPLLGGAFSSFFTGRGDTWTVMWVNVLTALVNVVLNYGLIFGRLGMPELGIRGAAVATLSATALGVLVFVWLMGRPVWRRRYGTFTYTAFRWPTFRRLIRFGGPSGLSFGLDICAFSMFTLLIGRIGTVELIASNITLAINSLSFLPMLGISMAVTIVVGQHIGQERKWAAERAAYTGAKLAAGYMFFMGMLFVLFPSVFLWIFQGKGIDPEMFQAVARYTRRMLVLVAILGVADAANMTFNGALKGAGDTLFSMWANVVIAWVVFIPPVYLCTVVLHTHVLWPWSWFVLYVVLLGAVYWWRFALGRWKEIDIREPVPVAPPVETTGEARVVES